MIERIKAGGVISQEIFLLGTRMVMVLRTTDEFDLSKRSAALQEDAKMQEWEDLMWKYQQPVPQARTGEKWVLMENIFSV